VSSTHLNRRGSSTHSNAPVARLQRGTPQNVINIPTQNVRRAGYSTTRSRAAPAFIKGGRQKVINIPKATEATDKYVTLDVAPATSLTMRQKKVINDGPLIIVGIPSTRRFKGNAAAVVDDRSLTIRHSDSKATEVTDDPVTLDETPATSLANVLTRHNHLPFGF